MPPRSYQNALDRHRRRRRAHGGRLPTALRTGEPLLALIDKRKGY